MKAAITQKKVTKFGELWDKNLMDLILEAASGMEADIVYLANNLANFDVRTETSKALGKEVKLFGGGELAGALAFQEAARAVNTGMYKKVLVLGAEKMSDFISDDTQELSLRGIATPENVFAMMKKTYMREKNVDEELIAQMPANSHTNAAGNKLAQYPFPVDASGVLRSNFVSSPLRTLECASVCDGAAAVLVESEGDLQVKGIGYGVSDLQLGKLPCVKQAMQKATSMNQISPTDIDTFEIHDSTSISGIISLEEIGVTTELNKLKVNQTGGLKACGNPWGATGVRQIAALNMQKLGLAQTLSGWESSCVSILEKC